MNFVPNLIKKLFLLKNIDKQTLYYNNNNLIEICNNEFFDKLNNLNMLLDNKINNTEFKKLNSNFNKFKIINIASNKESEKQKFIFIVLTQLNIELIIDYYKNIFNKSNNSDNNNNNYTSNEYNHQLINYILNTVIDNNSLKCIKGLISILILNIKNNFKMCLCIQIVEELICKYFLFSKSNTDKNNKQTNIKFLILRNFILNTINIVDFKSNIELIEFFESKTLFKLITSIPNLSYLIIDELNIKRIKFYYIENKKLNKFKNLKKENNIKINKNKKKASKKIKKLRLKIKKQFYKKLRKRFIIYNNKFYLNNYRIIEGNKNYNFYKFFNKLYDICYINKCSIIFLSNIKCLIKYNSNGIGSNRKFLYECNPFYYKNLTHNLILSRICPLEKSFDFNKNKNYLFYKPYYSLMSIQNNNVGNKVIFSYDDYYSSIIYSEYNKSNYDNNSEILSKEIDVNTNYNQDNYILYSKPSLIFKMFKKVSIE